MKDSKDRSIGMNINQEMETQEADANNLKKSPLDAFFKGINRLYVFIMSRTRFRVNPHSIVA